MEAHVVAIDHALNDPRWSHCESPNGAAEDSLGQRPGLAAICR